MVQHSINAIIAICILGLVMLYNHSTHYEVCGIALPGEHTLPASSTEGMLLFDHMPILAEAVGGVNVQLHFGKFSQPDMDKVIDIAKTLAASLGADGLVIKQFGYANPELTDSAQNIYNLQAIAIRAHA